MPQRAIDGEYIYFVTANVKDRRWYFVNPERSMKLSQAIQTCCVMKRFELLAYCILPNHVHLLVRKMQVGEINDQRMLGSMRWGNEKTLVATQSHTDGVFLYPHRRLPSRRSLEHRPTLSDLMHSIKSTFSQTLKQGPFWQHRSYVRTVEDENYLANLIEYMRFNYTKMKLPESYGKPPFVFIDDGAVVAAA
jgi:REP element-mobilizing transposase RayT